MLTNIPTVPQEAVTHLN